MTFVDDLLASGVEQLSRKYRLVARLPPGMTGLEALRERAPDRYHALTKRMAETTERLAADEYRRWVAKDHGDEFELTVEEFSEFLAKTGRSDWKPKGPACPHCKSFGHMHSPECPNGRR